jgi:hypothetical protein
MGEINTSQSGAQTVTVIVLDYLAAEPSSPVVQVKRRSEELGKLNFFLSGSIEKPSPSRRKLLSFVGRMLI